MQYITYAIHNICNIQFITYTIRNTIHKLYNTSMNARLGWAFSFFLFSDIICPSWLKFFFVVGIFNHLFLEGEYVVVFSIDVLDPRRSLLCLVIFATDVLDPRRSLNCYLFTCLLCFLVLFVYLIH